MIHILLLVFLLLTFSCSKESDLNDISDIILPDTIEPNTDVYVNTSSDVILGAPTDNSIVLSIAATNGTNILVNYGKLKNDLSNNISKVVYPNGIVEIILDNLDANSRYYYNIHYNGSPREGTYSFVTHRSKGSSVC